MKTVIFYSSTYNGNTLKIAESIAATLSADLIAIETKISDFDLSQYDLIGIGSAIHFGQHAIRLQRFVSALPLQILYLQLIIPQYFISNKSGIWSLSLIVHSKG